MDNFKYYSKKILSNMVWAFAIILLTRIIITGVFANSQVDGESMKPTLQDKDVVLVDKLTYKMGKPNRYDVIVFEKSKNNHLVKRVIGLPGDTVDVLDNKVFINGEELPEYYIDGDNKHINGYSNSIPEHYGGREYPLKLKPDTYYVMGDNRNNSLDSRFSDIGNIRIDNIVGRALLRIFPIKEFNVIR